MRRCCLLAVLACSILSLSALPAPDFSDGVQVLAMLAAPYGANTHLLKTQFELLGWEVTLAGIQRSVPACSRLCATLFADLVVDEIDSAEAYDVLVVMPTPGTFQRVRDPVGDLRASERAVALVREAHAGGASLYTGCSGILLLGDAGLLEGASVVAHPNRMANCTSYGAQCTRGSQTVAPMIDGQLVTATNQRVWPLEIAAAIARSLDAQAPVSPSIDSVTAVDMDATLDAVASDDPTVRAWTLGGDLPDVGRDVCIVADGTILVGTTTTPDRREDVRVTKLAVDGTVVWSKAIGGGGRDLGEAVCPSSDGGAFIAGTTTSAGAGAEDVLVLKLASDGELEWAAVFGGADYDAAFDLCPVGGGAVAVCGLTYSSGAGLSDVYVVKVGSSGQQVWAKTYGGTEIDRGHSIRCLDDGGFLIAGGTSSSGAGNADMLLLRLDSTGRELWSKPYGRNVYDIASSAIPLRDGGFLLTGHGDQEGSELMALTVVRVDASGDEIWTRRFGSGRDYDYGMDAVELPSGGFLVAGMTDDPSPGVHDVWLHVLDRDGRSISSMRFGGEASDWPVAACLDHDGDVLVFGGTGSYGSGSFDALLLKVSLE